MDNCVELVSVAPHADKYKPNLMSAALLANTWKTVLIKMVQSDCSICACKRSNAREVFQVRV